MIPYQKRWPTPEQIHNWLGSHGWTAQSPIPSEPGDGIDFTHREPADDGGPIWVCAPQTVEAGPNYGLCVAAVVTSAAWMEGRPEMNVFHEMLVLEPAHPASPSPPAPQPPSVPPFALAQSPAAAPSSD